MSRRRHPGHRVVVRRRGLVFVLVLAVMLMHTVVSGHAGAPAAATAGHEMPGHSAGHPESHGVDDAAMVASPVMVSAPEMTASEDCGDHVHDCVFTRAADVDLPAVVLVLLVWALAVLPRVTDTVRHRTTVLGRPPPWAIPSHLQLQVIRC
ncbi:hypothetical protein [Gordonia terrae]|uniref:hypothetical protein n=1 Tax=Gordonia terrae TaxID=2055 RepID=UPI003F6A9986